MTVPLLLLLCLTLVQHVLVAPAALVLPEGRARELEEQEQVAEH